jgi:NitT/TauT family transport system ATP-binding protein
MKVADLRKAGSAWPALNSSDGRPASDSDTAFLSGSAFLSVRGIGKTYGSGGSDPHEAIREISFDAREREFVCIVGPSGAGKTTLLRCLAGLLEPTKGSVHLGQRQVNAPPPEVAVVFQDYSRSLFPWLSVAGNIALPLKAKRLPRAERARLVADSLSAVNLDGTGHRYPWQLSGGMQQRVAIARALAYQPKLLLMDEPFASVDAQTRFELEDLVLRVREEFGMSIVFVTHDIDEAVYLGDRIIALSKSPCVVTRDLPIDLGPARNQLETRADPRFTKLRTEVLKLVTGQSAPTARAAGPGH